MCFPLVLQAFGVHPYHSLGVERASYGQIADAARRIGVRPGDQIASANESNFGTSKWAHLIHVQINAEVPYISGVPDEDP